VGPRDVVCRPIGEWKFPVARQPLSQLWVNSPSLGKVKTPTAEQAEDGCVRTTTTAGKAEEGNPIATWVNSGEYSG
jgi:hypothetical protein